MTKPAPHVLFQVWTPDTVAECLDGVYSAEGNLYETLWDMIPKTKPYDVEENGPHDVIGIGSLADSWHKLTDEQATKLNQLACEYKRKMGLI